VRAFLISNAIFWLDRYHADGLRMDAIASMLYLDYSRKAGEWIPNQFGGRENLGAVSFLKAVTARPTRTFPTFKPSPRSPHRGPWFPGLLTSAGSASA